MTAPRLNSRCGTFRSYLQSLVSAFTASVSLRMIWLPLTISLTKCNLWIASKVGWLWLRAKNDLINGFPFFSDQDVAHAAKIVPRRSDRSSRVTSLPQSGDGDSRVRIPRIRGQGMRHTPRALRRWKKENAFSPVQALQLKIEKRHQSPVQFRALISSYPKKSRCAN